MGKLLITERNYRDYLQNDGLVIPKGALVTPSAKDAAKKDGVKVVWESDLQTSCAAKPAVSSQKKCSSETKSDIKRILRESFGVEKPEHVSKLTAEVMKKIG